MKRSLRPRERPITEGLQYKKYFTLAEDALIINYLQTKKIRPSTSITKNLYHYFKEHSRESIRNRLRRYIVPLVPDDHALIVKEAVNCPEHYAYFEQTSKGCKQITRILPVPPMLYKTTGSAGDILRTDLSWLVGKLSSSDPYFAIEHSLLLLSTLFNELIERRLTSVEQVEAFILECRGPVTLDQILGKVIPPCPSAST